MVEAGARDTTSGGLTDPERFRAFYADALPRVYGYFLFRAGGNISTAEDLTQETFLAAVTQLRRGAVVTAPIPWVLGIARHKLVDHFRQQRLAGWSLVSWEDDIAADDELLVLPEDDPTVRERAARGGASPVRYADGDSRA